MSHCSSCCGRAASAARQQCGGQRHQPGQLLHVHCGGPGVGWWCRCQLPLCFSASHLKMAACTHEPSSFLVTAVAAAQHRGTSMSLSRLPGCVLHQGSSSVRETVQLANAHGNHLEAPPRAESQHRASMELEPGSGLPPLAHGGVGSSMLGRPTSAEVGPMSVDGGGADFTDSSESTGELYRPAWQASCLCAGFYRRDTPQSNRNALHLYRRRQRCI